MGVVLLVKPGRSYPLGATHDGSGTNFSLFSEGAQRVELSLIAADGSQECVDLTEMDGFVWHGYLPGVGPGQRYGFRVHGPYDPEQGQRCNPAKLLLDPYAKAIDGQIDGDESLFGYRFDDHDEPNDAMDSLGHTMLSVVTDGAFDWGDDRAPDLAYHHTIIYEAHVKGLTQTHPGLPEEIRGTYAAIGHPAIVEYLSWLGVTAVELMPVHQFVQDPHLKERGLSNYWGYNTIGFFAPHNAYSSSGSRGQQVTEFKAMVKSLHAAGIEAILDVGYNHTAEGNELGPTLSFKGIDNASYYRLLPDAPRYYINDTGTGNTLNLSHARVIQMVTDSLRYWAEQTRVDGFRFDLGTILAREPNGFDNQSGFLKACSQDPCLSRIKLIAEPWDCGPGGYQVGAFPPGWAEWNDKFRDTTRKFWIGNAPAAALTEILCASASIFHHQGRRPWASINFVTAHDGFTLNDVFSYNEKHNEANGEDNKDGSYNNNSWNCGAEGPTDDPDIIALRKRMIRNALTTLLLAQGTPMLLAGDEFGRTQSGNNNAYCQDNEISWLNWDFGTKGHSLIRFTQELTALRHRYPILRRGRYLTGQYNEELGVKDVTWINANGKEMEQEHRSE